MRIFACICGLMMSGWMMVSSAQADFYSARVEALGNAVLVLEDESTELSMFNLGNPAGAAFAPSRSRIDFLAVGGQSRYETEFISNSLTGVVTGRSVQNVFGNADIWRNQGYGGIFSWITPELVLQVIPQADYQKRTPDDQEEGRRLIAGGTARVAWRGNEVWSLGAGVVVLPEQTQGQSLVTPDALALTSSAWTHGSQQGTNVQAQVGSEYRLSGVFDSKDHLDLGVQLDAGRTQAQVQQTLTDWLGQPEATQSILRAPWAAQVQGVYDYQGVLDAGLVVGYQREKVTRAWNSNYFGDQSAYDYLDRENFDYELSLRVKLPMAREDDLRFGIVFNNRAIGHPYPTGRLIQTDPATSATTEINTAASSIGIGMAVVPAEGSLVALQYNLGSAVSKLRDVTIPMADSGVMDFSLGVQYRIVEGWFARLGYINEQVKFQFGEKGNLSNPLMNRVTETDSLRFGLGWASGNWQIDATGISTRGFHSPFGWTEALHVQDIVAGLKDQTTVYTGLLSVTYSLGTPASGDGGISRSSEKASSTTEE